jgi:hypothetical protein
VTDPIANLSPSKFAITLFNFRFIFPCLKLYTGHRWLTPVILATSGGRDQEDRSLKPAQANSPQDPIWKKNLHKKRAGGVAQDVGPDFKSQYH